MYVDLIQRKMFYSFIDNPGLESFFKDKSSQKVILQMSNSNWFIILSFSKNHMRSVCQLENKSRKKSLSEQLPVTLKHWLQNLLEGQVKRWLQSRRCFCPFSRGILRRFSLQTLVPDT